MLRLFASAALGSVATALVFVTLVIPTVRENWRAQGHNEGAIQARSEAATTLRSALRGEPTNCDRLRTLFNVKTTTVHLVNCSGIKTVRVEE